MTENLGMDVLSTKRKSVFENPLVYLSIYLGPQTPPSEHMTPVGGGGIRPPFLPQEFCFHQNGQK